MNSNNYIQVVIYCAALILLTPVFGIFMARVFQGKKTFMHFLFGWLETLIYKDTEVQTVNGDWYLLRILP